MFNYYYSVRNIIFPYYRIRPFFRNLVDKKDLIGCEIGVYEGANLKSILLHLDIKKIYLIEKDFKNLKYCKKQYINEFYNNCHFIEGNSLDVHKHIKNNSLDFCYIDSSHTYNDTLKEIELYFNKVKIGGVLGGHDFNNKNVSKAVFDSFDFDDIVDGEDWHVRKGEKKQVNL